MVKHIAFGLHRGSGLPKEYACNVVPHTAP